MRYFWAILFLGLLSIGLSERSQAQPMEEACAANPGFAGCQPDFPQTKQETCEKYPGWDGCKSDNMGTVVDPIAEGKPTEETQDREFEAPDPDTVTDQPPSEIDRAKAFIKELASEGDDDLDEAAQDKAGCDRSFIAGLERTLAKSRQDEAAVLVKLERAEAELTAHPEWQENIAATEKVVRKHAALKAELDDLVRWRGSLFDGLLGYMLGGFYASDEERRREQLQAVNQRIRQNDKTWKILNDLRREVGSLKVVNDILDGRQKAEYHADFIRELTVDLIEARSACD